MNDDPVLLDIDGVTKRFGGLAALKDVSFTVSRGEIKALIGPNGAGKTTLFDVLTGILRPTTGRVALKGEIVLGLRPDQITDLGMIRTFQTIQLFEGMTVLENAMVGCHSRTSAGFVSCGFLMPWALGEEKLIRREATRTLEEVGLETRASEIGTNLPYGQQRMLELARALASQPDILLLDEPAAGLNQYETGELSGLLTRLRDKGLTILIVEHDMGLVMDISDEVVVLDYGEVIARGTPEVVQNDPRVIEAYLGIEAE
ncbi:MAG: ABC transporter ATP-binding protein [Actinobacteria bacterium]|nr:ABC transporter ATP-binding protein [Actinomycetota bacterium]MBU1944649.1 ABC transporter ATP-binding protein [Actinomycetota bacterium]MBU2689197.1 ABC transporter ATP-binding protein [Actinomycetota bacterium]